ncbi:MAG: type II toxin-antitoxin system HicB family antitoxin [Defluviitaleaceae bacterium]|nr:type II toxin-antitoxin system HicB family antitoxin [Defluviitaleaceae bacterium]
MKYVYPIILEPDDGMISATVPDLRGCHTFGSDMAEALLMAKDAIEMWLWNAENENKPIPSPTLVANICAGANETVTLVAADTDEYRKANDTRAIKKTLSIPSWLNREAERANAPFSQILQQGLKDYLQKAN